MKTKPARWQATKTIRIPLKLMYIATAPFFLPIMPPKPPTACLSTFISVQNQKNMFIHLHLYSELGN
jgi:hypothetical protein